jgi:tripeptide aminopeptidase
MLHNYKFSVLDRFLRYVAIDTQSDSNSETSPSTKKQTDLGKLLANELKSLGLTAELDQYGYVYASVPSNSEAQIPVICFCSHMDTSPDCSGSNVKPIIHKNYQGADIILPDDTSQIIRLNEHSDLKDQIGNDIVTASGTTLLGADNKAGIAEIMDAVAFLTSHPEIKHGELRILFTPDEEIGRGVDKIDLQKLGADYCYTVDGETRGSIENETFSADEAVVTIHGLSTHPGFAKNKMESAIKIAADIISLLPKNKLSPESTDGREGFVHPVSIQGSVEKATLEFIIRDFDEHKLKNHRLFLQNLINTVLRNYPGSSADIKINEQYRNMKIVLDAYPRVIEFGIRAIERAGLAPKLQSIRGGTDGSRLSFIGLPSPNIFAGEHAFHSKKEWISVQDMQKSVETIVNIAVIWEEEFKRPL